MKPPENVGHFQSLTLGFKNFLYIFRSVRKLLLDLQNYLIHSQVAGNAVTKSNSQEEKIEMWTKPVAIEMSCGCEINMYAPAEGDRPLF